MKAEKVIIVGDLHGNIQYLRQLSQIQNNDTIIIQCGDFGIWDKLTFKAFDIPIYFCPGNHENWNLLETIKEPEISKNLFYMKRGSVITINNQNILFMGGAESIDKLCRKENIDWFPQESISEADIYNLPDKPIDIVVSHDCPDYFFKQMRIRNSYDGIPQTRKALTYIFDKYKPSRWFFGHYHMFMEGIYKDCHWHCLDMYGYDRTWFIETEI
jgi:hypothetical protein